MAARYPKVPERTRPGFGFSNIERAIQDCLGRRKFGGDEIEQVLSFFFPDGGVVCAYCASPELRRWDHVVPIKNGGETVLGNLVPACSRCDDSKRDLPFEVWMKGQERYSPTSWGVRDIDQRIKRIRAYAVHFGYVPRPLEQRLNAEELETLRLLRSRLRELRQDLDGLIRAHEKRVG